MANGSTSFHGIKGITFGVNDDLGMLVTDPSKGGVGTDGIELVDGDGQGATTANITGLEAKGTIQWANNKAKRESHGKSAPEVAITMLDMGHKLLQTLKGYDSDGKGGYTLRGGNKPHVAMLICSTGFDGNDYYEGFANGELIEAGHNHGTDNANETDANTTLSYAALTPLKDDVFLDSKGNQQPFKTWSSAEEGFDKAAMYAEVFGGYVLKAGTKTDSGASNTDTTTVH
ncbi:phage tail protein [Furfurilactobacillus sp. WILCCON 0119]|uniref:phage tail protein n=1 Tax=Furfurilactobacillus entadae TaxID=2922307 RepID=UPI0035E9129C